MDSMRKPFCRKFVFVLLFVFVATCCFISPAAASLQEYMTKHRGIQVTREQHKRLSDYEDLITYFCSFSFFEPRHKVNPDFIRALILAESNCKSKALSDKNARGLTQIIYTTGKQAARELVEKDIHFEYVSKEQLRQLKPEDLYKPEVNILLSCYLVAKYNYQNKGKLDLVVSAWNAGEYSITDNKPAQYKETLNHIGKVNGYFIDLLNNKESAN